MLACPKPGHGNNLGNNSGNNPEFPGAFMGRENPTKSKFLVRRPDTGGLTYHRRLPARWAPYLAGELSVSWSSRKYTLNGQTTIKISLSTSNAAQGEARRDEVHAALQGLVNAVKTKVDGASSRRTAITTVADLTPDRQRNIIDQVRYDILKEDDTSTLYPELDLNNLRAVAEIDGEEVSTNDPTYGG